MKTPANDIAVSEFAKYTDGYAMRVEINLTAAGSTLVFGNGNNKYFGFCLYAKDEGATCFIYKSTTTGGSLYITPRSFWLNEAEYQYYV